jgi:hypothetical protein
MLLKTYMYKGREVSVNVGQSDGKFWCSTPHIPIPPGSVGCSTMQLAILEANAAIDRAHVAAPSTYGELASALGKVIHEDGGGAPWLVVGDVKRLVEAFLKERSKYDSDGRWMVQ